MNAGNQRANRQAKADALLDAIDGALEHVGATRRVHLVELFDADQWEGIADIANVRLPSAQTRELVIKHMKTRLADIAQDPFQGLPYYD